MTAPPRLLYDELRIQNSIKCTAIGLRMTHSVVFSKTFQSALNLARALHFDFLTLSLSSGNRVTSVLCVTPTSQSLYSHAELPVFRNQSHPQIGRCQEGTLLLSFFDRQLSGTSNLGSSSDMYFFSHKIYICFLLFKCAHFAARP
jgi:hypothetical protein